ncbi:hypothetical protein IKF30_01645 [Candidatus Saccharibacteria bacterium]|nr:hypothetical protein [Candidatus Saccharibacteria bacterium]
MVIIVAVLTVLSALALVLGSAKTEKARSLWFLVAAIGSAIWGMSISVFLSLKNGEIQQMNAPKLVAGIYSGAIVMDVALLGYISWKYRLGKMLTAAFAVIGIALLTVFLYDPSVLYSSINLVSMGNSIAIDLGQWFYIAYALFFCTITPVFCGFLIYQIRHSRNKKQKKGYLFFLFGLSVAGLLSLIFDIILPPTRYDLIWIGPLTIGLVIIGFYYAILRFKMITLNANWLRVLSYIVIIGSALIVYLLIFHLVFSALFKIANPSFQVVLLNFIMIAIVLLLTPAISEINALTKSWIMTKQMNIAYIVKKITALNRKQIDLREMAGFLAEHMHFSYVGFIVNGKFYGSDDFRMGASEIEEIAKLKVLEKGVWQNVSQISGAKELEISRIGVLTNAKGEVIGQMVFGKPVSKVTLDRQDLTEVEMIVNLMAVVIENGGRKS